MLLLIDNYDSFTYNLAQYFGELGCELVVRRNDMISESGLQDPNVLRHLGELGFRGFLIGEVLMRAPDPEAALRDLIAATERATLRATIHTNDE